MLGINAVKGFEYGSGFEGTRLSGSNTTIFSSIRLLVFGPKQIIQRHSGGISNGEDIYFNVAFKPIATLLKEQQTVDKASNEVVINPKGRHDPCVLPRAVPIVEAMAAMVLADHYLLSRISRI
jgi:chorismate synthase